MASAFTARIPLRAEDFGRSEEQVVVSGPLSAAAFRFSTGVAGLRLQSDTGSVVVLPFQGQHVWSAHFGGRDLSWHSMVTEPRPHVDFLSTFGGIVQHCGLLAIGGPGPGDTHAVHGELPNAPFQEAWVEVGSDEVGPFIAVCGEYRHAAAFGSAYAARPRLLLRAGETLAHIELEVLNLAVSDLRMFYLSHINFRPVDGGRLVYSAPRDPAHVRARTEIPAHITPKAGYRELLEQYRDDPLSHETLLAGPRYDPEVVFFIDYAADADGFAHTLQVHHDGSADYVRHRPAELPRVTRWISRTPDQDAIAMAEVGTAEPLGLSAMLARGMETLVPGGGRWRCAYDFGMLPAAQAAPLIARVDAQR